MLRQAKDWLIVAEHLRQARLSLDALTGQGAYRGYARYAVRSFLRGQIAALASFHVKHIGSALTTAPALRYARGMSQDFDIIVVGGGHAGTEAAAVAARMGARVALVSFDS